MNPLFLQIEHHILVYSRMLCSTLIIKVTSKSGRVRNCISELVSLAVAAKRINELNDAYEMENLVDKFNLYQEYKSDYGLPPAITI